MFPIELPPVRDGAAAPLVFASPNTWMEGAATEQLRMTAALPGVTRAAAFPDLHPGRHGPVGCAILSDRLHPLLIGNDIGCGMALFVLDKPVRKLRLDKVTERLRALEGPWTGDARSRLEEAGLDDLHPHALGTIGGGNHFCELQAVEDGALDGDATLLVHSGSRALGTAVLERTPTPPDGLAPDGEEAHAYLHAHDRAVRWAALNRTVIAERAAEALRCDLEPIVDAPHNLVERGDGLLHRKGAAKADGTLVPLAGSRDAPSFLLRPTGANSDALGSLAHGAGRKYDRASMHGRVGRYRSDREALARNRSGGRVICEDRDLLIEEAPAAYKDSERVRDDLVTLGLVETVATLRPVVTFKKADTKPDRMRDDRRERRGRRSR